MLYTGGAPYRRIKRYHCFFRRAPRISRISEIFEGNLGRYQQIKVDFQNQLNKQN